MPRRKYFRKIYKKNKKKEFLKRAFKFLVFSFLFFVFFLLFLFIYYAKDLPRPEKFTERPYIQSTKIYDSSGEHLLYEMYGEEKREVISLNQVPEYLKEAVIVAEDSNFYSHFGLDLKGIFRSVLINLKIQKPIYGGSTISQQLIRSSFLTTEKTLKRKIKEIILTLELERRYSKDQILEWYLNQVPFGSNAYGIEAASKTFFNKTTSKLSIPEAATLSSLIRAPSYLSPYGEHKDELLTRKNYILNRMAELGYLTQETSEISKQEELKFSQTISPISAPHFVFYIRDYLLTKYGEDFLQRKGLRVYTSLNWEFQELAEEIIKERAEINENYRAYNASLVAINPKTGEILAMVGSKDWFSNPEPEGCTPGLNCLFESKVNISTYKIGRQPGSAFKPFAYAAAFKKGYTPDTILWDVKTNFGIWGAEPYIPQNYDGKFRGPVNFRNALAQSINIPSVKVLYLAGLKETIDMAENLGITTLNQSPDYYGLSLVLGGGEIKLLDIVSAYGVFANEGLKISPVAILKIEDSKGNIIEENKKNPKRVLEVQITRMINDILSDNEARAPMFGRNSSLYLKDYQTAAKTGTTQSYKDAWTIGYTPSIVVGVWVGNNDNSSMSEKPGVVLAGPIWKSFMEKILIEYPKEFFEKPEPILAEKPILNGEIKNNSILHFIEKDDPQGPLPQNPQTNPQYLNWEEGIKNYLNLKQVSL